MSEPATEHTHGGGMKHLLSTPAGKTGAVVLGLAVLYVLYRSRTAAAAAVAPTVAATGTNGSGGSVSGSGGSTAAAPAAPLSMAEQMSAWISGAEKSAIGTSPGDAALIDQTLADIQNNNPLTAVEQQQWQKILSQSGAPPSPVGYNNQPANLQGANPPGSPGAGGTPIDFSPVTGVLAQMEQELASIAALQSSPIAANGNAPSNSNVVATPPTPAPTYYHLPTFAGLAPGTALYAQDSNGNMYHIPNPAALQALPKGTAIYTKN